MFADTPTSSSSHCQLCIKREKLCVDVPASWDHGPRLDLCCSFKLLPSSEWPWRRWKDFNPQWNFLIPATCHHVHRLHTDRGAKPRAPRGHESSLRDGATPFIFITSTSAGFVVAWVYRRRGCSFVWQELCYWRGPVWPVQHPCWFCFQPWEHLGFVLGLTKKSLNCISPRPPFPPLNLQGCLTFASKWSPAGTKCLCHILQAAKGPFSYLRSTFPQRAIISERFWSDRMPLSTDKEAIYGDGEKWWMTQDADTV